MTGVAGVGIAADLPDTELVKERIPSPLWSRHVGRFLLACIGVVAAVAAWELAAHAMSNPVFPTFWTVVRRMGAIITAGELDDILLPTMGRWTVAYVSSAFIGLACGVALARVGVLRDLAMPVVDFVRAVPATLFVPAAIALFGLSSSMVIAVVVAGTTWPILISTVDGVSRVDPLTIDAARSCRIRRIGLLRVTLRAAVPELLAGLRIGLSVSLAVLVVTELIGATSGLGFFIRSSQQTFQIVDTYVGVVLIALLGWVLDSAFLLIERRLMAHSYRREVSR